MKKNIYMLFLLFSITNCYKLQAQYEWKKIYGVSEYTIGNQVIETYDHGYLISGYTERFNQLIKDGILIKTDINGEVLWKKIIGGGANDYVGSTFISQTYNGGYILLSDTYNFSYQPCKETRNLRY